MSDFRVVVTGAANGIGKAAVELMSATGAKIYAVDHDAEALERLELEVKSSGGAIAVGVADVSDSEQVQAYVERAVSHLGSIDGFFNNAGVVGQLAPLLSYPDEVFDRVIAVNLRGVFLGLKYVLRVMSAQKSGSIVNMASVAGLVGHVDHGGYVVSKHAVVGLTRVAGAEAAPFGVRVNAVAPGPVRTAMIEAIEEMKSPLDAELERSRLLANIPAGRYGTVEEVAKAVRFLLMGESTYLNGSVLTIDGGFTAIR
ncbi:Levodione reductase [Candidatus Protofrankia californiensis]|uniref:Levodione reductase n=1 Tax=Candidatus Protofrankia californiensis TaxID=1839754 RepID=A0A1C3NXJ7_9ACTN|nr:Levodione reductase [Candidatus Protofrankia californiensis]